MDQVLSLIDRAGFDQDDIDIGTGGFCAMFALALYRATIDLKPMLVLIVVTRDGKPMRTPKGELFWRHAAVKIGGNYYDIEGQQQPEWMIENYVWGIPNCEGKVLEMSPEQFVAEIRTTRNARDWRFYTKCKALFNQALGRSS